ncbi:MAG TPA: hypothetical protein DCP28_31100, partial [Cytophagales bacterium]|nr:hypothetical protein [Cytophagales bacterium]
KAMVLPLGGVGQPHCPGLTSGHPQLDDDLEETSRSVAVIPFGASGNKDWDTPKSSVGTVGRIKGWFGKEES